MSREPNLSLNHNSKIIIVGAGVFGLSTTLHLLKRGYTNIHLFDRQPFHSNHYAESAGADGASCDINKIVRASYGGQYLYQDLAFKAMPEWQRWNEELSATPASELPDSLSQDLKLWHNVGFLRLSGGNGGLAQSEIDTQANFPASIKDTQYRTSDPQRRNDALKAGTPSSKLDPFDRLSRDLPTDGILDTTAGFVLASHACAWALHLCQRSGHVTTHFGPSHALKSLLKAGDRVTAITTAAFERHTADFVLIACGGWTPSLLPETEQLLETTAGSILGIHIPGSRPDLRARFSGDNFPVWSWDMGGFGSDSGGFGGIYGLPLTPDNVLKIAFRGAKWTSYTRPSQTPSSTDKTAISYPETSLDQIPAEAMRVLRTFCVTHLPDLLTLDLTTCRLCWYTDSVDNSFLIDYVPKHENLVVASGGSGHGFKFLPVLGEHVVDVMERKESAYTRLFAWRDVPKGKKNGLEEGPEGWRTLDKQAMVGNEAWRTGKGLEEKCKL
ncbi:unnamed protein product [Zymoseptoria tritici ST99CH_1E4]|uniref:FAD dependent oxidoreductase domain-containing protein n=1 Tax=Zymoseptoria tritici ST99CH_1E4 TaxID=1276532 RepID=A0A2H1GZZ6_ZYMTR|nr:unnamed protein product [Zymoseptoria tritici ST99CH_1E4]